MKRIYYNSYKDYLKSDQWRNIKTEFNAMYKLYYGDPSICFLCLYNKTQALHHWYYPQNLNDDKWSNLLPVCHDCHTQIHKGFHDYAVANFQTKIDYMIECLSWYCTDSNRYYKRGYQRGYEDCQRGLSNNGGVNREL